MSIMCSVLQNPACAQHGNTACMFARFTWPLIPIPAKLCCACNSPQEGTLWAGQPLTDVYTGTAQKCSHQYVAQVRV